MSYPNDIFRSDIHEQVDGVDDAEAEDINCIYRELELIETEIGIQAKKGGESALAGYATLAKAGYLKGTSIQRTSGSFTFEVGQHFFETDTLKEYKCTVAGAPGTWVEIASVASPGSHASSHLPAGSDPITTGSPTHIYPDVATSEGTSQSFARSNHVHGINCAIPVQVGIGNSEGSALTFARSDHVHQTSAYTPSSDQKDALDGATSPSTSNPYATENYVDTLVGASAGLCMIAGNETAVNVTGTTATTVKDHRVIKCSTVLDISTLYVVAELLTSNASYTTTLTVEVDGVTRFTLTSTSTTYEVKSGTWDASGLSDNASHAITVKLKSSNASGVAYNRTYEMYMK